MFRNLVLLGGLLASLAVPALSPAEETTLAVPMVSPDFPDAESTLEFQVELPMAAISRLALRVVGLYQEVLYVDISQPYGSISRPAALEVSCGDGGATGWIASYSHAFPAGFGAFDFTQELLDDTHADWPLLEDGLLRLGLACGPASIMYTPGSYASAASSWGQATAVYLVVTYDSALPVETSSWDAVRALYR